MTTKLINKALVVIFFSAIGVLYLHNLTRDVYSGDIGDLVTATYVFGVAHPPGYPLFSLIGFILSHLPIPLPVVSRVGLISVFSSLAGLIIYYKFSMKVTKSMFISLLSTSILAFSYFFWLTAEIPEGLGLNNFFVIVILYLSIQFYEKKKARYLYLLALFTGLSLTHQLFILTLFPAVFILVIKQFKFIFTNKRFLFACLFFILGLSVYIYVPIAASRNPPINWDHASNLKNFLYLILRKDYGGITHTAQNVSLTVRIINVIHYLKTIVAVFSYQILLVSFLGILKLFKVDKRLAASLLLAFLLTGVITIFYTAGIISSTTGWGVVERYYSVSTVVLMFVVSYGFLAIKDFLNSLFSKHIYSYFILTYFLIIPFLLFKYNFPKTDLSKTKIGNTLARNVFASLPQNAVLFVSGDNITFSIWYRYYVLKERQDLDIINPPGVGNNLYLDKELNNYYSKNPKVDMKDLITDTFNTIRKKRRMFTIKEIRPMPKETILLPKGLVSEVVDRLELPGEEEYLADVKETWQRVKVQRRESLTLSEENFLASEIPLIYSQGLVRIGDFLNSQYQDPKKAVSYYQRALLIDDTNPQAYSGLATSLYKGNKNCDQALQNIKRAISIYPVWKQYYRQQYYLSKNCQVNEKILGNLKQEYRSLFGQDIE